MTAGRPPAPPAVPFSPGRANQPRLLDVPIAGLYPLDVAEANRLLVAWGHNLGPLNRPFTMLAYAVELDGRPVSLAMSASTVGATAGGYPRTAVVELARLCTDPAHRWATRVMLRLWREACAPRWPDWPVVAALSYSQNKHHEGHIYQLDGWKVLAEDCGSNGGAAWSRKRYAGEAAHGKKTLWGYRYDR
jgi:hypothetical protein